MHRPKQRKLGRCGLGAQGVIMDEYVREDVGVVPTSSGLVPKMAGMAVLSFIFLLALAYLFDATDRPVAQHVRAAPYVWPSGCKQVVATDSVGHRFYRHEIPRACMDQDYYISDPGKYGLPGTKYKFPILFKQSGSGRHYYRIGPDAVETFCLGDGRCFIDKVERDVFSESGNTGE
jgi:hypothetical protein